MNLPYSIIIRLARLYYKLFYRHQVYGQKEHFYRGGAILAANHTSFLDPPIVAISWPEEVHFLARESLFKHFGFGSLIRTLNAHPVSGDVSDIKVLKTLMQLLTEGKKIVLFPEGTRSQDGTLGVIKPGIGLLITRTNTAIVPAYIHGAQEAWGRGRSLPKLFGKTTCVFGTPITAAQFAHLDKKEALQAIADKLSHSIEALKQWYLAGAKGTPP